MQSHIGKTIGILGGGQLGKMMSADAHRLALKVVALDPTPDCPCQGFVDKLLVGDFKDSEQVLRLQGEGCSVVTVEIEHVNVDSLVKLEKSGVQVQPSSSTVRLIQDKYLQKQAMSKLGIPVAPFTEISSVAELQSAIVTFGLPLMLKSRRLAYDGRGNFAIYSHSQVEEAMQKLGGANLYAEKWVNFSKELSVMVAQSIDGSIACYPVVETIHLDSVCRTVIAPARIPREQAKKAMELAKKVVRHFEGAGIYGIEMFLVNGEILLNEIAPRPHNSGHYTIEGCSTSQFEQHIRAILGIPLGDTSMTSSNAVMVNLLGTGEGDQEMRRTLLPAEKAMTIPGASVHWYGKKQVKKNRKMGHITIVGQSEYHVNQAFAKLQMNNLQAAEDQLLKESPLVGIIMGSDSDLPKMKAAAEILKSMKIEFEVTIVSAHRTPDRMYEYAKTAHLRGLRVIIAGAGGAAHLPGMVAALTPLPVIGVPVSLEPLNGVDSLHSIVQMPRGVPVATVAINNSTNAGLLAARILGYINISSSEGSVLDAVADHQEKMKNEVLTKVEVLDKKGWDKY